MKYLRTIESIKLDSIYSPKSEEPFRDKPDANEVKTKKKKTQEKESHTSKTPEINDNNEHDE